MVQHRRRTRVEVQGRIYSLEIRHSTRVVLFRRSDKSFHLWNRRTRNRRWHKKGKITMNIPENHEIWIPDRVRKLFGLEGDNPLRLGYTGDHPVEFSSQRISVYLRQLSTTGNFLNESTSNLLDFIPLTDVPFGEYFFFFGRLFQTNHASVK